MDGGAPRDRGVGVGLGLVRLLVVSTLAVSLGSLLGGTEGEVLTAGC